MLAAAYLQVRLPQPSPTDISQLLPANTNSLSVVVTGTVIERSQLTRRGSVQVWLRVNSAEYGEQRTVASAPIGQVRGKLYVTLPRKSVTELAPGQTLRITGRLMRPAPATRPQSYDFAATLAKQGTFAHLSGQQVTVLSPPPAWGTWAVRQRIVRSLQAGTSSRLGALLSGLVLGKNAADIPYDLRDAFIQSGLAHALAASGFQVSLILGAILSLQRWLTPPNIMAIGSGALLLFGVLGGAEASIVRAILMGFASLVALGLERRIRPVGALLAIATLMLLYDPLWIQDLGFQLSVLATLGLMVTVPPLTARLDWLPPTIAALVAVPVAATLWTLPLQLYTFGVLPVYCVLANILSAPLLSVLTLGGFVCSAIAFVWPGLGSLVVGLLFWPLQGLVALVGLFSQLPGRSLAVGTIALPQLIGLYGCLGAVWLWPWCQKRWRWVGALALLLVLLPIWRVQSQQVQVTVFDRTRLPMLVIQHPRSTVVLNSGDRWTASQMLVPFLQRQGINRVDLAIATDNRREIAEGWTALQHQLPITTLSYTVSDIASLKPSGASPQRHITLNPQEQVTLGAIQVKLWRSQPLFLELTIEGQRWLLAAGTDETDLAAWLAQQPIEAVQVLWWTGGPLSPQVLQPLHPKTVILSGRRLPLAMIDALSQADMKVFWTEQNGSLQWNPKDGFQGFLNPGEDTLSPL